MLVKVKTADKPSVELEIIGSDCIYAEVGGKEIFLEGVKAKTVDAIAQSLEEIAGRVLSMAS